jgi:small subunit ribosomal protein S27Ae
MEIYIKNLTGKSFTLDVEASDTIAMVKNKIEEHEGLPYSEQRLVS